MVNELSQRRGTLHLIAVACLILSGLFVVISIPLFWEQIHLLHSWPQTEGQVTRSQVVTIPSGKHGQLYSAQLQITYLVNGNPVTAELMTGQSRDYAETARRAAEFPVGSRHPIRYDPRRNDPKQPAQARIGAGWNSRFFAAPLIALACALPFALVAAGLFVTARATTPA